MLEAAARLFGAEQFHKVRMEDIAAAAAVGKGTLYRYFEDKDELYLALIQRAAKKVQDQTEAAVHAAVGTRAKLAAMATSLVEFHDANPHVVAMVQRVESLGQDSPWGGAREAKLTMCQHILAEAERLGEFKVTHSHFAARGFLGLVRSVVLDSRRPRPANYGNEIVAMFLDGVAHK